MGWRDLILTDAKLPSRLFLALGQNFERWQRFQGTADRIPLKGMWTVEKIALTLFGLLITGLLVAIIIRPGLLELIGEADNARGFITFFFATATVGIFVLFAISILWHDNFETMEKRLEPMKNLLTLLISILGTILGFYFGSATAERAATQDPPQASAPVTPAADSPS